METRWARVLRGWSAGGFATLVAAISHALAGGTFANVVGLVLAFTFSGVTCMALAGRRLSLSRLSMSVLISQFAFHFVFSAIGAGAGAGHVVGTVGHHGDGYMLVSGSQPAMTMTGVDSGRWMWLAHFLAAIVTIAGLRFGESAFWGLRDSARMLVAVLWRGIPAAHAFVGAADVSPVAPRSIAPRIEREFLEAVRYRGPPAAVRFA